MTTTTDRNHRARRAGLLLVASVLASTAVLAADPPTAQVTIRGERPTSKVVGHTSSGIPVEQYELAYHVKYTDLDLSTPVGANALKARVYTAADSLCKDLDKLYPMAERDTSCIQKVQDGAMSQVNAAITVAQAQTKTKAK
jgi:UrcA family protein